MGFRDHLSTTNEEGQRIQLNPAAVKGRFSFLRSWVRAVLFVFFLVVPWIEIRGEPFLRLDVPGRRFFLGGHLFLPQDVPGIIFVFGTFIFSMGLLTALLGRAWCGWACPQTVFIEGFFRRVEAWIEGDHLARRALVKAPWGVGKISKKALKWSAFLLGSLVITHSFLAYFVGPHEVLSMMTKAPAENPGSFFLVLLSTGVILFDFGWFREQFCLIACPYGRFQSILMDSNTYTVAYDRNRGEPRRSGGDCIDCGKCVSVCPTGIDIRNGLQMECIACTACIDACNPVMEKIGKPKGLIRYESERGLAGKKTKILRGRVAIYSVLLAIFAGGLAYELNEHETLQSEVLRSIDIPYQILPPVDGSPQVLNHFNVGLYNLSATPTSATIKIPEDWKAKGVTLAMGENGDLAIPSGEKVRRPLFIKFPSAILTAGQAKIELSIEWREAIHQKVTVQTQEVTLVGPTDVR